MKQNIFPTVCVNDNTCIKCVRQQRVDERSVHVWKLKTLNRLNVANKSSQLMCSFWLPLVIISGIALSCQQLLLCNWKSVQNAQGQIWRKSFHYNCPWTNIVLMILNAGRGNMGWCSRCQRTASVQSVNISLWYGVIWGEADLVRPTHKGSHTHTLTQTQICQNAAVAAGLGDVKTVTDCWQRQCDKFVSTDVN